MTEQLNQPKGSIQLVNEDGSGSALYNLGVDTNDRVMYEEYEDSTDNRNFANNARIKVIVKPSHSKLHNLTEAIKRGDQIDWPQLDGATAQCIHEDLGTITHKLHRNSATSELEPRGWANSKKQPAMWCLALREAWLGIDGWTLYVDRPVPLKRKTADQLEPGTCFRGEVLDPLPDENPDYPYCQLLNAPAGYKQVVAYRSNMATFSIFLNPQHIAVVAEYGIGTFKPGSEA